LDKNDYVWSNSSETVVLDASALTSGHGGKANDALDDTKNNAVIIWINGEGWLVATREIYFYEEICAAYGWVYWKDHPKLLLQEKARLYYESIQFEQAQQDREQRLSTAQKKRIQQTRSAQTVDQCETEPETKITKKRIRKTDGIVTPVLPSHVLPVNKEAGSRHKKTQRSSIECFFHVVAKKVENVVNDDMKGSLVREVSEMMCMLDNSVIDCDAVPIARTAHDLASHMG
jgi:hypothetical protein